MCRISFFCFSFFFLIIPHHSALSGHHDMIDQTCKICADKSATFNYNFCLTSLQAIPISHATNLQGLALVALELALANATDTVSGIKMSLNSTSFDYFSLACLEDCLELYSDAVMTVVDSIGAFLSEHYNIAKMCLSEVMEAPRTCETGFAEKEGEVSPLTKENYNLSQLCDISLCIIDLLSVAVPYLLKS